MARKRVLLIVCAVVIALLAGGFVGYKAYRANQDREALARACEAVIALNESVEARRAKAAGDDPELAVIGDSYAQGQYLDDPLDAFPYVLADNLGMSVTVEAVGGTGYVRAGPCGDQQLVSRLDAALATSPELLIVEAGINDAALEGVGAAADSLFASIKERSPSTEVVVVGPFAPPGGPDVTAASTAISEAAAAHGFEFVDPRDWEFEVLEDQLHPSREGHETIAADLAKALDQ